MVYQQIVGSRLISLLLREGFYVKPPDIQTVLPHRQVQLFLYLSIYIDDIFTIGNPEFAEHVSDIYPREFRMNKANTSDKECFSFLEI